MKQEMAALKILQAVAETIREMGEVPSGVLYAHLMGMVDLETYTALIGILKRAGVVQESGHVLRWTGKREASK
jgi:hypothetical protein